MRHPLSPEDRARISEAIRQGEARTSGEIYCVLARSSDDYIYPSAFLIATGVLLSSLAAATMLRTLWLDVTPLAFAFAQVAALAAMLALAWLSPSLRLMLTPPSLRRRRAHANAVGQFLAHNVHLTEERTGVLIFVSLAERHAEIVADAGITAKVPQQAWDDIVAALVAAARSGRLADGYVGAATSVADLLAQHFPRRNDDRNELDDHLVEL